MDDDDAMAWAIKLDARPLSPEEQAEFDVWLAVDERRHGALLRAESILNYLDRGRALAETHDQPSQDEEDYHDNPVVRPLIARRRFLLGGAAAGLGAAGLTGLLFWRPFAAPQAQQIATAVGEVRRMPLPDGSMASINTATKLAMAVEPQRRRVTLEDGEAWFQVAHDKTKPFIVEAGNVRVQAVGTAFSVRRRPDGADVLVTEGVVETWVVGRESERTSISAGGRTFVPEAALAVEVVKAPEDIDRALAWRTGELALNGEPLSYAVAELNRYNVRQLVVADPALAREPLVGYFRTDEPEKFGLHVATMMGGRVENDGQTIRIVRAR